ncbi:MAG: zf-HC2 domain-containing protein, partial [Deltaproteobacteria bacterium]|nr:zf-HC2 domain-containing protein [Deltaproteobacteria bacterium]
CETIRNELVAYRDGELPERDRARIAAHLRTCLACTQEEARLARVNQLLANLERITPSPDFATTFWRRLKQEGQVEQESWFARWWREWLTGWQWAPALAATASLLVFLGYLFSGHPTTPTPPPAPPDVPAQVAKQPGLFVNYKILADLDRLAHFDEIAAVESTPEHTSELAREEDLPPAVLENPGFFVHYPILQKMEQLQNLETVLDLPGDEDQQHRG